MEKVLSLLGWYYKKYFSHLMSYKGEILHLDGKHSRKNIRSFLQYDSDVRFKVISATLQFDGSY